MAEALKDASIWAAMSSVPSAVWRGRQVESRRLGVSEHEWSAREGSECERAGTAEQATHEVLVHEGFELSHCVETDKREDERRCELTNLKVVFASEILEVMDGGGRD